MKREFKFRAWNKQENRYNGRYLDDSFVITENGELLFMNPYGWEVTHVFNKNNYIVEFSTGINDREGNEIYEGDILGVKDTDRAYLVEWNMEHGCYTSIIGGIENYIGDIGEEIRFNLLSNMRLDRCEIIGNIHENPELLEVE